MPEEKIMTKLEEHDKQFVQVDKRLSNLEVGQDKLIKIVMQHTDMMGNFVTKDEFHKFRDDVLDGQDKMIAILKRLDEERVFTHKWVKEVEEKVETALKD